MASAARVSCRSLHRFLCSLSPEETAPRRDARGTASAAGRSGRSPGGVPIRCSAPHPVEFPRLERPLVREEGTIVQTITRAEARITKLLTEGLKVGDITQRLEVSTATVRTHVRRVLEKTDVRGQSDLIRIVMAGPGALLLRDKTGD